MPNAVKWIANVGKSLGYSVIDNLKDLNPTIASFKDDNGDYVKTLYETINIKDIKDSKAKLSDNQYFKLARDTIDNLKSDIKTGKLYNKEREKEAESSMFGMDLSFDDADFGFGDDSNSTDMDFNFDDDDSDAIMESAKSINKTADLVGEKASMAVSKAVVGSSEYIVKSGRQNTKALFDQNNVLFSKIHADMGTINTNITNILEFAKEASVPHYNNSATFYTTMTSKIEETNSLLKELVDMQKELYGKDDNSKYSLNSKPNNYSAIIGSNGMPNLQSFFENAKNNIKDKASMLDMVGTFMEMGGGSMISASPGKMLTNGLINLLTPKNLKEAFKDFNKTLSGVFANMLMKINDEKNGIGIKSLLANIFGTNESLKTGLSTYNYKKGPVPFDGITRKAIIEVIPTYLSKIVSVLSNQGETRYDYKNGRFVSMDQIKNELRDITSGNARMAAWDMNNAMMELASKTVKFDKDKNGNFITRDQFQKDLQAFFEYQYRQGKVFNGRKQDIDAATYGMKGGKKSEISAKLIKDLWNGLPNNERMKLAGEILEQRRSQTESMQRIEADGDDVMLNLFNDSGATKLSAFKKSNNKEDAYAASAKYSGNIISILSDIRKEVSYIRTYGVGGSSSGKRPKRGKKGASYTDFNNYNPYTDNTPVKEEESSGGFFFGFDGPIIGPDGKPLPPLERKDGETDEEFQERVRERIKAGKNSKNGKKILDDIMNATSSGSTLKAISKNMGTILRKPAEFLTTVIRKADESVFDLVFGKEGDKENKGILYEMKAGIRNTFKNVDEWLKDNIFEPLKEKLTVDNLKAGVNKIFALFGLDFDSVTKTVKDFLSETKTKISNRLFGEKDKDGKHSENSIFGKFINDTKKSLMDSLGWVKGTINDAAEWMGIKGVFNEEGKKKKAKKERAAKIIKDAKEKQKKERANKEAEEILNDVGQAATGIKRVPKTGIYALSQGEAVIPPDYNPANIRKRYRNEQAAIDKYRKHGGINMLAEGSDTDKAKEEKKKQSKYDERINKAQKIKNQKFTKEDYEELPLYMKIGEEFNKLFQVLKAFTGDIKGKTQEAINKEVGGEAAIMFNGFAAEIKDKLPDMAAGGLIGGGVSLITGMIGGPLVGAAVGAASGLIIKSDKVQKILFGELDPETGEYKNGILPSKLSNFINKYIPGMAKGGTLGGIIGLLPGGFGPVTGMILGSAAGFVAKNEKVYNTLFGKESILYDFPNKVKKALPKMGVGAAIGSLAGPFGLVTNMILGSAAGFVADTDKFKDLIFGKEDKDGNRQDGLLKTVADIISDPIKNFVSDNVSDFKEWFRDVIKRNLNDFFTPLKNYTTHLMDNISDFFKEKIHDKIIKPIERKLKGPLSLLGKLIKLPFNIGKGVANFTLGLVPRTLGFIGRRWTKSQIAKGQAFDKVARERLDYRDEYGIGTRTDKMLGVDKTLAGLNLDQINTIKESVDFVRGNKSNTRKIINDSTKSLNKSIKENTGNLNNRELKKLRSYLNNNKYKQAVAYVSKLNGIDDESKKKLIDDIDNYGQQISRANYIRKGLRSKGAVGEEYRNKLKEHKDNLAKLGIDLKDINLNDLSRLLDVEKEDRLSNDAYESAKKTESFQDDVVNHLKDTVEQLKMLNQQLLGGDVDIEKETTKNLQKKLRNAGNRADIHNKYRYFEEQGERPTAAGRWFDNKKKNIAKGISTAYNTIKEKGGDFIFGAEKKISGAKTFAHRGTKYIPRAFERVNEFRKDVGRDATDYFQDTYYDIKDYFNNRNNKNNKAAEGLLGAPRSGLYALSKGEYIIPKLAEGTENIDEKKKNELNKNRSAVRLRLIDKLLQKEIADVDKSGKMGKLLLEDNNEDQSTTEQVTEFYNGMPIKMYKDDNGDLHPDTSDSETVETIKAREEDRTTQKGILSSIKDVPGRIIEFFGGHRKDDKKKNSNLFAKILKIAGIAMVGTALAPYIGKFFSETVVPVLGKLFNKVKDVLSDFKDGLLGKGDGEGLPELIGSKIRTGAIFITDWLSGSGEFKNKGLPNLLPDLIKNKIAPPLLRGFDYLMQNVVPKAVEIFVSNIPGILGGIISGLGNLGKALSDSINNKKVFNINDFEGVGSDTYGGIQSISSGSSDIYQPSSAWNLTGATYSSGLTGKNVTSESKDQYGNQVNKINTSIEKDIYKSDVANKKKENGNPSAYTKVASNKLNKYKDTLDELLDDKVDFTVENPETGEVTNKSMSVYDLLSSDEVVYWMASENRDGTTSYTGVKGNELLNYPVAAKEVLKTDLSLTSDEKEAEAKKKGYNHGDTLTSITTDNIPIKTGRSIVSSIRHGGTLADKTLNLMGKGLELAHRKTSSKILKGSSKILSQSNKIGKAFEKSVVNAAADTAESLAEVNNVLLSDKIKTFLANLKKYIIEAFKDSDVVKFISDKLGKGTKEVSESLAKTAPDIAEEAADQITKSTAAQASINAAKSTAKTVFKLVNVAIDFMTGYYQAANTAQILEESCTVGTRIIAGLCNIVSQTVSGGWIDVKIIFSLLIKGLKKLLGDDVLNIDKLRDEADRTIALEQEQLGSDYTIEDHNKKYKINYGDYNYNLSQARSLYGNNEDAINKYIEENISKDNTVGNNLLNQKKSKDTKRKDANNEYITNLAQQRIDSGAVPEGKSLEDVKKDIAAEMQMEGMYAAGTPYVPKSGLYALSKGEYVGKIPMLAEGTIKDNINSSYTMKYLQDMYDYAASGDDKFLTRLSDETDTTTKMVNLVAKRIFNPVYAMEKMQKYIINKLSYETGDGDKVLEKFNKTLADTNKYLTGKSTMKNYWNDSLEDDTSMYGNMAKVMTTIHKTLLLPMIMTKSLFQSMSGQKGSGTVDAVSTNNNTTDTTTSDLNATTIDNTSSNTTKDSKKSTSILGMAKSAVNTVKEKALSIGSTIVGGVKSLFGKGSYVGGGSEAPDVATPNAYNTKIYKYTNNPKVKSLSNAEISKLTLDRSSVGDNFVSQNNGNIANTRFNTSLDTTNQTVSDSGCAPAVATMVINSIRGKSSIDMNTAVKDALQYKVPNSGVSSNYFDDEFSKYGISTEYISNDNPNDINKSAIVKAINESRPTILLGQDSDNSNKSKSPFGPNPHYVVAESISKDGKYIYINDPESKTPRTRYSLKDILPKVKVGITTFIGRKARQASNKLKMYIGGARKQVKASSGDYIGKYVKEFESGNKGPKCTGSCGNDGGGSYGSYQMIYSYNGSEGSARQFWGQYFASKYGIPTSPQDLNKKWIQAVKDEGENEFFAKEWEFMLANYYKEAVKKLKDKGFDPDNYSRAMQDCIWSWAVHRGPGGCASEFSNVLSKIKNPMEADETELINTCYDVRASALSGGSWSSISTGRYGTGSSSERAKILAIAGQDPIDYTTPDGVLSSGETPGSDISESVDNSSGEKSIIDILLAPFDAIARKYKLIGDSNTTTTSGSDSTQYNSDGISGTVSSNQEIAQKQVKVVSQMNSVYGKLKYAQDNAKYPGSRDPDTGSGDCSSTVQWAYKKALGVDVGGWSGGQKDSSNTYIVDKGNNASGKPNESNLQLGDILLYGTDAGAHAEMYSGNGQVLTHGDPAKLGPTFASLTRRNDYWGAKRLNQFKSTGTSTFSGSGSGIGRGSFVSQLDPKYASKEFNIPGDTTKQTIGDSGCAPAAATMVLNDIFGNGSGMLDSTKLALKYKQNNDGVSSDYFQDIYSRNGLNTNYYDRKEQVTSDLRNGKDVVLLGSDKTNTSKTNSPFGPNPHYVVASGMSRDGKSITIKDPESRSPKKYNARKILDSTKLGIGYGSGLKKLKSKLRKFVGRGFGQFSGILYVGDSRTDMMKDCISEDGVYFIAKVGAGLSWLKSTASNEVAAKIKEDPNLAIVFNFGVNDLHNSSNYVKWYTQFEKDNPSAKIYFMSVNPVDKDPDGYATDEEVQKFNTTMQSHFGGKYLDVYSYLKSSGYKTTDGLHYDDETSKKIHERVKELLGASSTSTTTTTTTNSTSVLDKILGVFGNIASAYGLTVKTATSNTTNSAGNTSIGPGSTFPTYNLTDNQLNDVATCITGETGGNDLFASMQEASQMANLNEVTYGKSNTGDNLYNTLHGGWYASSSWSRGVTDTAKQAAKSVLVEGKRTLPRYVTEHDTFPMDIVNAKERSEYKFGDSVSNRYGSNYKFYDFFGQNKDGDISGYFQKDYDKYSGDQPWSVGSGSGLFNNKYLKSNIGRGTEDVLSVLDKYTEQLGSTIQNVNTNSSTTVTKDDTSSLLKAIIKLLAQIVDNTQDVSEIVEILSKIVNIQSDSTKAGAKQDLTNLKSQLVNKLNNYNRSNTGSDNLSALMDSIENLAME